MWLLVAIVALIGVVFAVGPARARVLRRRPLPADPGFPRRALSDDPYRD
ncbi:MAG TPA: hypothetical protein VFQ53_21495 [Kofleriaceae bacterium]|nr:hypothetical protein [Kofleriaceae bacterium]